jgi:FkbM family methyltransferase
VPLGNVQIFVLGDHRSTSNHLHRPETDELAKMDDPIERCHLTDDYTVRDGKAVLRYNRRSQREEECSHLASERSKVVAAVSDCPFLISVYDKVDGADVDIVSSGIRTSGFWEPRETGMIADLPQGSLVVDIGANIGWHTLVALSLGHTVIAFEPMVGNLGLLEHSLCLNPGLDSKLTLHRTALSDSDKGECHIEADADNIGDGTLWCGARESHGWQTGIFEEHAVALSTLDQKILPGTEIDLIKIDVEGHEMAVVKGGADLFSGKGGHIKPRYVMTEFCPDLIVQQGYDPSELLKFFLTRGYKVQFDPTQHTCALPFLGQDLPHFDLRPETEISVKISLTLAPCSSSPPLPLSLALFLLTLLSSFPFPLLLLSPSSSPHHHTHTALCREVSILADLSRAPRRQDGLLARPLALTGPTWHFLWVESATLSEMLVSDRSRSNSPSRLDVHLLQNRMVVSIPG